MACPQCPSPLEGGPAWTCCLTPSSKSLHLKQNKTKQKSISPGSTGGRSSPGPGRPYLPVKRGSGGQNCLCPLGCPYCAKEAFSGVGCGCGPAIPILSHFSQNSENPRILNVNQAFQVILKDSQGGRIKRFY